MADSPVLTVRLAQGELDRLDTVAARRGISRSQLVQATLREVLEADERSVEHARDALRSEFRAAVEAQDAFRDRASLSAEFRRV